MESTSPHPSDQNKVRTQSTTKQSKTPRSWRSRGIVFGLLLLGIIVCAPIGIQYYQQWRATHVGFKRSLSVIHVSPNKDAAIPKNIAITLNDKVDLHILEHNFFLSPDITGTFKLTETKANTFVYTFTPSTPFARGVRYSLRVAAGIQSTSGLILENDYYHTFETILADNTVQFMKDGIAGKVLSYSSNNTVTVKVKNSQDIESVQANLYTSSEVELLAYVSYKPANSNSPNYYPWGERGEFHTTSIPHTVKQRIRTLPVTKNGEEITFTLEDGIYYLEAIGADNKAVGATFLIVHSTGLVVRQDDRQVTVSAFDLATNMPVVDPISLKFYTTVNQPKVLQQHTLNGIGTYAFSYEDRLDFVLATKGSQTMLVPLAVPHSLADLQVSSNLDKTYKIFLYTDRPIYKPKDTLFYRGIVRTDGDGLYSVPPEGTTVYMRLSNNAQNGQPPTAIQASTDEHGIFTGYLTLPDETAEYQSLMASTLPPEDTTTYPRSDTYASFDVITYVKPDFDITVEREKSEYLRSDNPVFTIKGNKFDGKPLADTDISVVVYSRSYFESEKAVYNTNFNITSFGGMCGGGGWDEYYGESIETKTVHLDNTGTATLTVDPRKKSDIYSQKITVVAEKVDNAKNKITGASSTIVHAADYAIFFSPSANEYKPGEEIVSPFHAETLIGEKLANRSFSYEITIENPQRYLSSGTPQEIQLQKGDVSTDGLGRGIVRYQIPNTQKSLTYTVRVYTDDTEGNLAQNRKQLWIKAPDPVSDEQNYWELQSNSQTYLKIVSDKNSFIVGDTVSLSVKSPVALDALMSLERGRIYAPKIIHLAAGDNTITIPIDDTLSPSITVVFSFFAENTYRSEGLSLNVPAMHKLLNVNLSSDKSVYNPNEQALVTISTTDETTQTPVIANVSLALVDRAIYALRKSATPPIHSTLYYFRPRRTNASSSLTAIGTYDWGGRGGGGGGGGLGQKQVDTLYWNPNILTDGNGQATVSVPLGPTSTIWRASAYASTDRTHVGQATMDFRVGK